MTTHLVDLGWMIARFHLADNPQVQSVDVISLPTFANGPTATIRLHPRQAVELARAILKHFESDGDVA